MSEDKIVFYEFGGFRLDLVNCRLLKSGIPVPLTQKSFEILQILIKKRDRMLRKEELLKIVWDDCYVEEATLTQHIYMLRKALQQNGQVFIETIPKNGYRFVAEVNEITPEQENLTPENKAASGTFSKPGSGFSQNSAKIEKIDPADLANHSLVKSRIFSRKIFIIFAVFCVLAVSLGLLYFLPNENSPPVSESPKIRAIAVLPFQHLAEEKDEKLGLGMADVLITKLGNVENLKVLPTSSVIRYAEKDFSNLADVGKNLGVDAVLTGIIQRDGEDIRVTIQFYSMEKQDFLWSEKFDEKFSNIFLLQDSISERISKELAARIRGYSQNTASSQYTENVEAHQAYSMGLYYWNLRTEEGFKKAISYFRTAIEKDSNFALAYAYLADTYSLIGYYKLDFIPREEAVEKARTMAEKALELDPKCSEAMTALATIPDGENHGESFKLLKKAIEIKPNNAAAHQRIAWMYAGEGNFPKALQEMKTAQNLDPQSRITNIALAQLLNLARQPDEAIVYLRRVMELNPDDREAKLKLAESLEQIGDLAEAEKQVQEVLKPDENNEKALALLSRIYAKRGKKKESQKILESLASAKNSEYVAYEIALIHTVLGNQKEAVGWLKKSTKENRIIYLFIRNDYNLDSLRQLEEFNKLLIT